MKRSAEKIGTGNLKGQKKASPLAETPKPGISTKLKTEVKISKTKTPLPLQQAPRLRNLKPKSRSSSLIEKCDHSFKKKENAENKSNVEKKVGRFEKPKKFNSLDHVGYSSSRDVSRPSVAKKVSNVLQQRKNSKMSLQSYSNRVLVPKILHSYPSRLNFLSHKPQGLAENQGAGKIQSFHAIKIVNKIKRPCKCASVENNKSEKPVGVFNVHSKSYRKISDPFVKTVSSSDPLWDRIQYLNSQSLANSSRDSEGNNRARTKHPINSAKNNLEDKNFRNDKFILDCFAKSSEPSYQFRDSVENPNEHSRQDFLPEKKTMKICQCLHFHTDDGLRQFALQNKLNNQEVGQKLFRVKYVLKKDDEENEQSDSFDKETVPERILVTAPIPQPKNIFPKKCSLRPKNMPITCEQAQDGVRDDGIRIQKLSSIESSFSELGKNQHKSNAFKNKPTTFPYKFSDMQTQKQTETSAQALEELPMENNEFKKAKKELETLKRLFSKLNSMDSLSFKEEMMGNQKKPPADSKSLGVSSKKWMGSQVLAEKACQMLKDIEAEEIYLREKNKLRQKIIRHVQNFIKLEFNEN